MGIDGHEDCRNYLDVDVIIQFVSFVIGCGGVGYEEKVACIHMGIK